MNTKTMVAAALLALTGVACAGDAEPVARQVLDQQSTTTDDGWAVSRCADNPECAEAARNPTTTTAPPETVPPTTTTTENPELSNARRSARSYLDMMGFSRQGLIDQLSSEYGDQYPVDVATAAVDSLHADWNAEAVESATSYLQMQGFSHAGLVDQLSSEYGDQFTPEQAEHGASVALG